MPGEQMKQALVKQPFMSLCLKAYNQNEYIGAALDGAFAQTYRPMEIVISDDCSTDGTSEIIRARIDKYKANGGDIPVIYNRNKINLGNHGNWLVFGSIAHGEILVKADGDDISHPQRVERIAEAWVSDGCKAKVISHRSVMIDRSGHSLGPGRRVSAVDMLGACQAWTIDCWNAFENSIPQERGIFDDHIFSARAQLIGGEEEGLVMQDALVYYRCGSGESTMQNLFSKRNYRVNCIRTNSKRQAIWDIEHVKVPVPFERKEKIIGRLKGLILKTEMQNKLLNGRSFSERYKAYKFVNVKGVNVFNLLYLISPVFGDFLANLCVMLKRFWLRFKYGEKVIGN